MCVQRFGVAERLGMDEVFVDVTKEVRRRLGTGESDGLWHGHVHMVAGQEGRVASDNVHRPMDLRAENTTGRSILITVCMDSCLDCRMETMHTHHMFSPSSRPVSVLSCLGGLDYCRQLR